MGVPKFESEKPWICSLPITPWKLVRSHTKKSSDSELEQRPNPKTSTRSITLKQIHNHEQYKCYISSHPQLNPDPPPRLPLVVRLAVSAQIRLSRIF